MMKAYYICSILRYPIYGSLSCRVIFYLDRFKLNCRAMPSSLMLFAQASVKYRASTVADVSVTGRVFMHDQ